MDKIEILRLYKNCKVRFKKNYGREYLPHYQKLYGKCTFTKGDIVKLHPTGIVELFLKAWGRMNDKDEFTSLLDAITPILRPMSAMDKQEVLCYCFTRFPLPLTSWNTGREKLDGWKCNYDADGWHVKNKYNDYTYNFNENAEMIIVNTDRDTLEPEMNIVEGVDYLRSINIDIDNLITSGEAEVEQ